MPLKIRDLVKIYESTYIILLYSLILNMIYANSVKLGALDFEKIPPLAGTFTFGYIQTRNVLKRFRSKRIGVQESQFDLDKFLVIFLWNR